MVYRIFTEKKNEFALEAAALSTDLREILGIASIENLRIINRYDIEGINEKVLDDAISTVFSEPQLDNVSTELDFGDAKAFAVEYLPGQFDQRAESAAECIGLMAACTRPSVRSAKIYVLDGQISADDIDKIKKYVINPVECREATFELPLTLSVDSAAGDYPEILTGFITESDDALAGRIVEMGLAMDADDLRFCRDYFAKEGRDPSITELRVIDTYWSDHCRHTTFLTHIDSVRFEDKLLESAYNRYIKMRKRLGVKKPITLMDIATIGAKYLKQAGKLEALDESDEINACTVKIKVETEHGAEDYLLLFKNETHNHPTEIEPFGGAATCIGGAIRDPLSGRAYVYAAMRVTGAADPRGGIEETLPGKLPQRKIVTTAAAGYSSYGNQIGLATGVVDELYHEGYAAKRMEIGAVIGAVPAENVRREVPIPGDAVVLIGGRTGRDGCGGATGSSKAHSTDSLKKCGAEVQKGNAPEERKLQRLFRNPEVTSLIKRCNDFGAGGVSVAVGELADGLEIDLDAVPKKYDGLDGTELAISESQERMAVVVANSDVDRFIELAGKENIESSVIAHVTAEKRLVMNYRGKRIVDISREFLNSNGAEKHIDITPAAPAGFERKVPSDFFEGVSDLLGDLNVCSKRGLSERFDSTIGAGTVLMPFGGKYQATPIGAMVHKIPTECKDARTVSFMAWGFNPYISEKSPYHGAYLAVVESISKLIAAGAPFKDVYLSFQEYFERLNSDGKRWGKPLAALLGALDAQCALGCASIGGKDSMSGSFDKLDVPPTLVSFAVTAGKLDNVISNEFKNIGSKVVLLEPQCNENGLPDGESLKAIFGKVEMLIREKKVVSAYAVSYGGTVEAILKMCFGNRFGFDFETADMNMLFGYRYGAFVLELAENTEVDGAKYIGRVSGMRIVTYANKSMPIYKLESIWKLPLAEVFPEVPKRCLEADASLPVYNTPAKAHSCFGFAKPRVLIPVFPGTNCEYDSAAAVRRAGMEPVTVVIKNRCASEVAESAKYISELIRKSQIVFIPGGFSGGDEPDGSGKFITAFFRGQALSEAVCELLSKRDGLMLGICNGFQALIKLGLVPYGKIVKMSPDSPTLTYNTVGRHISRIVRTKIVSDKSPWLLKCRTGEVYSVPISHGEGRFIADEETVKALAANGQIATQYVGFDDEPSYNPESNPNSSCYAIEGITSPDGRVFGKMGHSERLSCGTYLNVAGEYDMHLFESAAEYYKL